MKIEINTGFGRKVSSLEPGDTFLHENELYLRLECADWLKCLSSATILCVRLSDGKPFKFFNDQFVVPVDAKAVYNESF